MQLVKDVEDGQGGDAPLRYHHNRPNPAAPLPCPQGSSSFRCRKRPTEIESSRRYDRRGG